MDIQKFEKFLKKELPISTSLNNVILWLNLQNYEHSELNDQKIYSSRTIRKWLFINTKWLMVFHFDNNNLLVGIDVKEDYVAL